MIDKIELLPCPFCGQQDAFVEQLDADASVVICQGRIDEYSACLARGPVGVQESEEEDQPGRDAAIRDWNRRAAITQQPAPPAAETSVQLLAEIRKRLQWYDGVDFVRMADVECVLAEAVSAATEQPDALRVPVETLRRIHRDLDACQKVIWLAGCRPRGYGFDPAYVSDAQERLKEIDALLAGGEA